MTSLANTGLLLNTQVPQQAVRTQDHENKGNDKRQEIPLIVTQILYVGTLGYL